MGQIAINGFWKDNRVIFGIGPLGRGWDFVITKNKSLKQLDKDAKGIILFGVFIGKTRRKKPRYDQIRP